MKIAQWQFPHRKDKKKNFIKLKINCLSLNVSFHNGLLHTCRQIAMKKKTTDKINDHRFHIILTKNVILKLILNKSPNVLL